MGRKNKQISLEDSERITLRYASKYHPKAEVRDKCHGLLLNHSGMSQKDVALHLGVSQNTVGSWIKTWTKSGIAGLCRKTGQGRKPILSTSNDKHSQLIEKILEQQNQSIKAIQAELMTELAVQMSTDTVKRYLKKMIIHGEESVDVPIKVSKRKSI